MNLEATNENLYNNADSFAMAFDSAWNSCDLGNDKEKRIEEKIQVIKASGKNGKGTGIILIREIEKEFEFNYEVLSPKYLKAQFSLNLKDFKIPDISYMGVGVKNIVKIKVIAPYRTKK